MHVDGRVKSLATMAGAADAPAAASPSRTAGAESLLLLFAATLVVSAALMFIVEPMVAKMLLPRLGGSPAVWNTCVVFFQAVLLAAYLYAHLLARRLPLGQQVLTHAVVLAAGAVFLPIRLGDSWVPAVTGTPVWSLLGILTTGLGLPFFAMAATAPLLQRWLSQTDHRSASDPYFLYAASNAGSLGALLAYPFIIEPSWSLNEQRALWTGGYAGLILLVVCSSAVAYRRGVRGRETTHSEIEIAASTGPVTWCARARWVALSAVPSSLMLGVTAYLSTDVAAVPLLWTIPLSVYLLSFVVAFARRRIVRDELVLRGIPLVLVPLVLTMVADVSGPLWLLVPMHLAVLYLLALQLHTQLAASRPAAQYLTGFYGWVAFGGLVGGGFNTLVAPLLFTDVAEYPAALVLAAALCVWPRRTDLRLQINDVLLPAGVGVLSALAALASTSPPDARLTMALAAPAALLCFSFSRRPTRFALSIALLLLGGQLSSARTGTEVHATRSFFGTLRVTADSQQHTLWHGTTIHGAQSRAAGLEREPSTYYHRSGPIGQLFEAKAPDWTRASIGVVGLGVGSLAAYAQASQRWTFYEIDPAVEQIARDRRFFTHLSDCRNCEVRLGDARLSLASRTNVRHDLLILDAFSSDAVPVHLLTREALDLYWRRLSSDGVLAFHISNRHLDLRDVLAAVAAEQGYAARAQMHRVTGTESAASTSEWFLMARRERDLGSIINDGRWERAAADRGLRVWTDDYSNVFGALKSRGLSWE